MSNRSIECRRHVELEATLRLALMALEQLIVERTCEAMDAGEKAITAIKEALMSVADGAQPAVAEQHKQEPVAWIDKFGNTTFNKERGMTPLYTTPPQRKPMTDEQKDAARWRFLVSNSFDKYGLAQFHVWHHTWEPHSQTSEPTEWKARVRGPALKRVIDEAIEAAHGIKE